MKTFWSLCGLVLCIWPATGISAPAAWRFGLPAQVLDITNSLAQPGSVRPPVSTNNTLEIVNWQAALSSSNQPGEFVLKLAQPLPVGTIVTYEPGEASFMVSNQWRRLSVGQEEGRKLQILPLPPAEVVEALKFVVPARATNEKYQATLPFVTLLPVRLLNISLDAQVRASSPQAGVSPQTLLDGIIDPKRNFSASRRDRQPAEPAWIELSWKEPRTLRGMILLRGSEDPRASLIVEAFTSTNALPSAWTTNGWETVRGRWTSPGTFRGDEFFVALSRLSARALRLSSINELDQIGLGEIVVLRELGLEPAPAGKKNTQASQKGSGP
jgi:hypothetical protein